MSMQDLTSDFVARINNAIRSGNSTTVVLKNRIVINICKKLTKLGYFNGFEDQGNTLSVDLNLTKVHKLVRVSKPGQRIYVSYDNLPKLIGGYGFNLITSSKGVITNHESKQEKVGGELLMQVY